MNSRFLCDMIDLSRDGEWGESEPFDGCVQMAAIRGTDFDAVRYGDGRSVPIRFIKEHIAKYKILHGGEIVIEAAGGSKGQITGRTIYLKPKTIARFGIPVTCASFSRFIRLKQSELWDTRYVFWLLQYLYHFGFMHRYHTQHTGVSRFQWTIFAENEPLPLPPLPTQRKIASIISAYDDLIENNLRRIKMLEEMAQNLYREWFVKFRFPGHQHARFVDSPLGRIPEGWEVKTLGNLVTIDKGISYKGEFLTDDGIPMVNLKCIPPGGGFNRNGTKPYAGEYKSRHKVVSGDLVFANTDLTQAGNIIGSPGLIPRCDFGQGGIASHHICIVRVGKHSTVGRIFLFHLLQSGGFREYAKGCASGTTVLGFRSDDALAFEFVLPPPQLTERFEQIASDLYDLGESLNERNTTLRRTRDLLLPRLISGEVDVSELDITVPEEAV